jgi:hypothetical protein
VSQNPFDEAFAGFAQPAAEPEVVARRDEPKHPEPPAKLITEPGAYPGITGAQYHGVEICDTPSISASGLILIEDKSPAHYWVKSPLNPNRKPQGSKTHFAIGHLLHDILLHKGMLPTDYHIVPDGFTPAHKHKWADELPGYLEAVAAGMNILHKSEFDLACAMAESADRHELAGALLMQGEPEMTLACRDPKTGRWIRAQPDILPTTMDIVPDVKTAIDASPSAYERSASKWGYFQSAAHYLDVLEILYGEGSTKRRFVHIVIEKQPPYLVTIYHLDDGDIHYGRMLNRRALDLFDRCLKTGDWHGYSAPDQPILQLLMAGFARKRIDQRIELGELSWDL